MTQLFDNIFAEGACATHDELYAYIEGRLSASDKNRIERHLLNCEMCADELEGLRMLPKHDTESTISEITTVLHEKYVRKTRVVPLFTPKRILAVAAALALVVGIGFLLRPYFANRIDVQVAQHVEEKPQQTIQQQLQQKPLTDAQILESDSEPQPRLISAPKIEGKLKSEVRESKEIAISQNEKVIVEDEEVYVESSVDELVAEEYVADKQIAEPVSATNMQVREYAQSDDTKLSSKKSVQLSRSKSEAPAAQSINNEVQDMAGVAAPQPDIKQTAMQFYSSGNFAEAIPYFETMLSQNAANIEARYYLGICYFETKQDRKGKSFLKMVVDSNDSTFAALAKQYLLKR